MSKLQTKSEIKKQIKWLETNKTKVRHHTVFGDDHWDAIEAQLRVLREEMSEEDIFDKFQLAKNPDDEGDNIVEENVQSAALEARRWMDGEEETSPIENWKSLVWK